MSAQSSLSDELFIGRRDNARAIIGAPGKLILLSRSADCILVDLSCTGARICTAETLHPGVEAFVQMDRLELFGQILWGKRGQFGMVFDQPLAVEQVIQMRWLSKQLCEKAKGDAIARIRNWVEGRV